MKRELNEIERQRAAIQKFDQLFAKQNLSSHYGQNLLVGIFEVFGLIFMCMPMSMVGENVLVLLEGIMFSYATQLYLLRYLQCKEDGKEGSVYKKMKYLPVDIKQVKWMRIYYLWRHKRKLILIAVLLQIGFTLLIQHEFQIWNVLYAIGMSGILPLCYGITIICFYSAESFADR